jgi:hypothetical protein
MFFKIKKGEEFKTRLRSFVEAGGITSAQDALDMKKKIIETKTEAIQRCRPAKIQSLPGVNIAFTSTGLGAVSQHQDPDRLPNMC